MVKYYEKHSPSGKLALRVIQIMCGTFLASLTHVKFGDTGSYPSTSDVTFSINNEQSFKNDKKLSRNTLVDPSLPMWHLVTLSRPPPAPKRHKII